jgi:hypothetical protein
MRAWPNCSSWRPPPHWPSLTPPAHRQPRPHRHRIRTRDEQKWQPVGRSVATLENADVGGVEDADGERRTGQFGRRPRHGAGVRADAGGHACQRAGGSRAPGHSRSLTGVTEDFVLRGQSAGSGHCRTHADRQGCRTVAAASERDAASSLSPERFAMSSRSAYRPVVMAYAPVSGLQLYYEVHGSGKPARAATRWPADHRP